MTTSASIYANLPKIIFIEGITDAGEYGAATCPHCGAQGRYIYHFRCDDGTERGAMAGCIQKFPQHEFVNIHKTILEKERDYARKGWTLSRWDTEIIDAIRGFAHGEIEEWEARQIVRTNQKAKSNYAKKKYGRR